jgi:hypothetical protein
VNSKGCALSMMLLVVLQASAPGRVLANGAVFGFGAGTVFPLASESVRLESEFVDVWLPGDGRPEWDGLVVCTYRLRNLAQQQQEFTMGFVADASSQSYPPDIMSYFYRAADFNARVGDRPANVEIRAVESSKWPASLGSAPDSIPVWSLSMAADASEIVEIRYRIKAGGGADGDHIYLDTEYRARPATLWAESIAHAVITFHIDPLAAALLRCGSRDTTGCVGVSIRPAGYTQQGNTIRWELWDWEPSEDFRFTADWFEPE